MSGLAFLSYRRSDSAAQAQALYVQLKARYGSGQLYMDANSIDTGAKWPVVIASALSRATVILALVGPQWLTSSDEYGRRRLDSKSDWVRRELEHAMRSDVSVIPVLIGSTELPPRAALPKSIRDLPGQQAFRLHDDAASWMDDVRALGDRLLSHGLTDTDVRPDALPLPSPAKQNLPPINANKLAHELKTLPGWEPWEDSLAREYPAVRQELRKNFLFDTFAEAIDFMAFMRPRFDGLNHHPRWGNDWRLVTVRLTTWDARNRITKWDVRAAHEVDAGYTEFMTSRDQRGRGAHSQRR